MLTAALGKTTCARSRPGHIRRTSNMSAFLVTLALIFFSLGSALAITASDVHVAGTDHNWTIHFGQHYYGVSGNNAFAQPGIRVPNETRIHVGRRMYSLVLPFY